MVVATSALRAGMDYASVSLILHLDAPTGLLDYAQETDHAGRAGAPADCLILPPPG
jgi:superfamily II DNA helicase RecQ